MAVAEAAGNTVPRNKSDLRVRTLSAIVMVAVTVAALLIGGYAWMMFVALVAVGVLWEWVKLSRAIASGLPGLVTWSVAGLVYVGVAAGMLIKLNLMGGEPLLMIISGVIATDVGAYFTGRTIGGPKIAPHISPSKTWSGLIGGILFAAIVQFPQLDRFWICWFCGPDYIWQSAMRNALMAGAFIAIIAQSGDFFESWMKRRAGVKDSGNLIPGHGGLFDRVDGLLAVCFAVGVLAMMSFGVLGILQ